MVVGGLGDPLWSKSPALKELLTVVVVGGIEFAIKPDLYTNYGYAFEIVELLEIG